MQSQACSVFSNAKNTCRGHAGRVGQRKLQQRRYRKTWHFLVVKYNVKLLYVINLCLTKLELRLYANRLEGKTNRAWFLKINSQGILKSHPYKHVIRSGRWRGARFTYQLNNQYKSPANTSYSGFQCKRKANYMTTQSRNPYSGLLLTELSLLQTSPEILLHRGGWKLHTATLRCNLQKCGSFSKSTLLLWGSWTH
jgi:hypothetical protein